ncbi:MAG: 5-formyltetrahydrofolate cyclo-ligase [Rhodoglobus sp.]
MSVGTAGEKHSLRAAIRQRRRGMTADERADAAAAVTKNLVQLVGELGSRSLAAHLSLPSEPGTRPFIAWAHDQRIEILLPISGADGQLNWAPYDGGAQGQDAIGMPIPTSAPLGPAAVNRVDLMIIPAASVDRSGMRLGWGRGYFDRVLGSMLHRPPVYAVILDAEFVDTVPTERHDQPVTGVVTPSGIFHF